jgi:hypothetical protein
VNNSHLAALVFFGATGDLAYKKIFPALQAMLKRGHLNVPVIGVAKAGWTLDQLRARDFDSLEKHGGADSAAFEKLSSLLRYVDGDYNDPATFKAHGKELKGIQRPAHYLTIPPTMFEEVLEQLQYSAVRRMLGSSSRSRSVTTWSLRNISTRFFSESSTRRRFAGSTTISASGRCITWSSFASQTLSWKPSGTATISRACKKLWRRIWCPESWRFSTIKTGNP